MRFRFLTGDVNWQDYGGKFVSKKLNDGVADYWLVIRFENMHELTGDEGHPKYWASLCIISPDELGPEMLARAMHFSGLEDRDPATLTDLMKADLLHGYGAYDDACQFTGNNCQRVLKEARDEARYYER